MEDIHEFHKFFGFTELAGRSKKSNYLVSPGTGKRMLHHWKQFYMGITHIILVFGKLMGHFNIIQATISFSGNAFPGSQVHFIYVKRLVKRIMISPVFHPFRILPLIVQFPQLADEKF
jgi:hypothetical protein